jgi:hypothetical protein
MASRFSRILLLALLLRPVASEGQAYVKSIEYVEMTIGNAATTVSAGLTKGQAIANCVPFASAMSTGADQNFEQILTDVYFTAGPNVNARREFSGGTIDLGVYVVEFDPTYVRVQQNMLTMPNGSTTVTTGITGVDTTKAALVFYYRGTFNSHKWLDHAIAGRFSMPNQLSFQRDGSLDAGTIHWYVFEALNSEFSVQPVALGIAGGGTQGNVGISAVDLTKSFIIASYRTTYDDDNMRSAGTIVFLNSNVQVRVQRNFGSSFPISDIQAFVVTLTGADVRRGSLSYTGAQATSPITGVSTDVSMVWNGVGTGPGVMTSAANASADVETAFQRLKLANATTVQGDRRESTFNALGRYEVINFGAGATPVELSSFTAEAGEESVLLEWRTGSEIDNLGFHLYRAARAEGPFARITERPIPGLGSSPAGARYTHRDDDVQNDVTYYYKLEDIDASGARQMHGPVSATPRVGESLPAPASRITVGEPRETLLRVLPSAPNELVVELVTGGFSAELQEDGTVRLSVPGFSRLEEKGFPALPVKRSWLPIAGRSLKLATVEHFDEERFEYLLPENAVAARIEASARTVKLRGNGRWQGPVLRSDYPDPPVRTLDTAFQEDVRKALVEIAPLRFRGESRELVLAKRMVVRFEVVGAKESRGSRRSRAPLRSIVARLETEDAGLTGVRFEEIFPGRRHRPVSSSSIRLSRQGRTVPFHVSGDAFGPGATLYFLSDGASANPYGPKAVYELEVGAGGERMPHRNGAPEGPPTSFYWEQVQKEEDRLYQAALVDAPDPWLWSLLFAPARESFAFEVSALAAVDAPASLSVRLQGTSDFPADPDHHVRLFVNGTFAGERSWNGKDSVRVELEVAPGVLRDGENVLELESVGDTEAEYSMVMLDQFEVSYPRRLEAVDGRLTGSWSQSGAATVAGAASALVVETSSADVAWLEGVERGPRGARFHARAGARYHVVSPDAVATVHVRWPLPSRLRDTKQKVDYLLIGPRDLLGAASPLATLRREQGLRVRTVPIEEVFSEFGFGEETPEAVRDFLAYAYHDWEERPRYVLLLGDASYDFKDRLGTGVQNQVPPLLISTSYLTTASDPAYAAVNGEDLLPDLAIGRLPAASVDELRAMVSKILDYERSTVPRSGRAVLVADDPDDAGDFVANARALEEGILRSRPVETIRLGELGTAETRERIRRAFDHGHSLSSYIGHGGIHVWADEDVFNVGDVSSLAPQGEQPILLTMNCLNGYFHFPYFNSLAEELLKAEGKGVVAAFSPSGLSLNDAAHVFHEALLAEILQGGHRRLGDAVLAAQSTYAESGAFPELIAIYHLFGDPALVLR